MAISAKTPIFQGLTEECRQGHKNRPANLSIPVYYPKSRNSLHATAQQNRFWTARRSQIKIANIRVYGEQGRHVLAADCDGFNLWYKFPDSIKPEVRADAFVAACLVPSMVLGSDIELPVDVPVSPQLLANLDLLQDIFASWSNHFKTKFHKIKISGGVAAPVQNGLDKTMSFFSGGIDGAYTFLKNEQDIDFLMFAKGIDLQLTSDDLFADALQINAAYLRTKGKDVLPIETNVRYLGHHYGLSWSMCFGGGLSSIALAAKVKKCYIASGITYASKDYEGSNFITDRLWSTEFTRIVHDGAEADRGTKLKYIAHDPGLTTVLRVCWQDKSYNCGECEKCLRTMTSLRALRLRFATLPELTDSLIDEKLRRVKLYTERDLEFCEGSLRYALEAGDKKLSQVLLRIKRNYQARFVLRYLRSIIRSG